MRKPLADLGQNLKTKSVMIFNETKARIKSVKSLKAMQSTDRVTIYENDYVDQLVNDDLEFERKCTQQRAEEEREHFHDLIHEIDADAFTVAMGGLFVEVIFIGIFSTTVLLDQSNVDFDSDSDTDTISSSNNDSIEIMELIIATTGLSLVIILIFWVFTKFVTFIQMSRVCSVENVE